MKGKGPTVEESIRIEAYLLSEKAGHPSGMDAYFWEQARAIVAARAEVVAVAVKKSKSAKAKPKAKNAAKPKAVKETTPKAAPKKAAATAKEPTLPLGDETPAPAPAPRKRASKK